MRNMRAIFVGRGRVERLRIGKIGRVRKTGQVYSQEEYRKNRKN
jgi:hypothetical protein